MKLKKITALFMCALMFFTLAAPLALAQSALPESPHNYPDSYYNVWEYSADSSAKGLLVSFSQDTWVEAYDHVNYFENGDTIADVLSKYRWGDYIMLCDGNGALVGLYDGYELAGKTVFVPGSSFSVILSSDSSVNGYGFKVTAVEICPPEDVVEVTYNSGLADTPAVTRTYYRPENIFIAESFESLRDCSYPENYVFIGWSSSENGDIVYNGGETVPVSEQPGELYARWCPLALNPEEVYEFNNSMKYFNVDGTGKYYMTKENYSRMQKNLYKNYGLGPVPGPILSIALSFYPDKTYRGSCYGMSLTVALQHFGIIDMLSTQNVSCVRELEPDSDMISYINYYQSQAATSYLCENKAGITDSFNYANQLKNMYKSVSEGNIVQFTYYKGTALVSSGHSILLTGAYTDAEGNHILIAYDCNRPWQYEAGNYQSRLVISPDWSSISTQNPDGAIGAINWTDSFEQFKSFDINGEGEPITWYQSYFKHIIDAFKKFFEAFFAVFSVFR